MIAIDFRGTYLKYGVFESDSAGAPIHPVDCECEGFLKCKYWAFRPHPKQIRLFDCQTSRVMFGGGRGPGKTESLVWGPIFDAYKVPGCKNITFRRTMGELKKTIIQRYNDIERWGLFEKVTEDGVKFENGSINWFGSADDEKAIRKLLSGEYYKMRFDEWSEWPLSMWKFAEGSVRAPVTKDRFGEPAVAQIIGATNPGGMGGAALACLFGADGKGKRQAPGEDPTLYDPSDYEFIPALVGDNPAYASGTVAGEAYRKMLRSQPRRVQAAWIEGRWDGFEGQYFENLDESVTKLPHDQFLRLIAKQHWAPRWMSIDWGQRHHAVCGWWALLTLDKYEVPVLYRTYITKGIGEAAFAQELVDYTEVNERKRIDKVYLSPDCFGDSSLSRARRMGDVFATADMPRPVPAMNSRIDGWRLCDDLLRERLEVEFGFLRRTIAGVLITDHRVDPVPTEGDWPTVMECLAQAVCDPKKDGDVLREGDALHLDVNDMWRYGIGSRISPKRQPLEDQIKDKLEALPVEGNARFMEHVKLLKKDREGDNSGVFYLHGFRGRKRR
jgi:phage terminase large subunit